MDQDGLQLWPARELDRSCGIWYAFDAGGYVLGESPDDVVAITTLTEVAASGDERVAAGTEREVLEAFLDFHREVLIRKVCGVCERDARYRRVPSRTTLAGLVKHMTGVERGWFQRVLAGRPAEEIGPQCRRRRRQLGARRRRDGPVAGRGILAHL